MRWLHPDGSTIHVAYCTNVHGGTELDEILAQLDRFAVPVRDALGADPLGLGLWLAAPAAATLASDPGAVERLRSALAARRLEVVTLNGFPYRDFQQPVVKYDVYQPAWTDTARLDHTVNLARVLAALLPDDAAEGTISTLPLGWRTPWYGDRQALAVRNLGRLADQLHAVHADTGRRIRVGLEPEPGCIVETVDDVIARTGELDHDVIGVCLDLCHLAVQFEDARSAYERLTAAGLPVVKAQVSAALHADDPHKPATRAALASFAEERFLHQVRELGSSPGRRELRGRDDLPDALEGRRALRPRTGTHPWRVHFHVPLGHQPEPPLRATYDDLRASLGVLVGGATAATHHLEVETYTWSVLPEAVRPRTDPDLARAIAGELDWLRHELRGLGLKELP